MNESNIFGVTDWQYHIRDVLAIQKALSFLSIGPMYLSPAYMNFVKESNQDHMSQNALGFPLRKNWKSVFQTIYMSTL